MATGTEPSAAGVWTEERLAELRARCAVQNDRARGAGLTARKQLEDARRRRDEARQRAGARIWPMWKARSARYDRYGPVKAMWSDDRSSDPQAGEGDGLAVLERVVQELFDVSLLITACRSATADPVTERLDQAVARLDTLIRDVRLLVFRPVERHPAGVAVVLAGDGPAGIRARLEDVSVELFRWADGQSDGSAALHWRDAAQCVSRALGVLNEEDGSGDQVTLAPG